MSTEKQLLHGYVFNIKKPQNTAKATAKNNKIPQILRIHQYIILFTLYYSSLKFIKKALITILCTIRSLL